MKHKSFTTKQMINEMGGKLEIMNPDKRLLSKTYKELRQLNSQKKKKPKKKNPNLQKLQVLH